MEFWFTVVWILSLPPELMCLSKYNLPGFRFSSDIKSVQVLRDKGIEQQLIETLMANYSSAARPTSDPLRPVEVSIAFYLTQLMSLDEKNQMLTTFGWMETYWIDEYLTWKPEEHGGIEEVILPPHKLWIPDFGIENSAKAIYNEDFFKWFRVSLTHYGLANWVPGGRFVTSCVLDITFYPFDDQSCHIDLVNWAYSGLQVKLVNGSSVIGLDAYTESGEWEVLKTESMSGDNYYESHPGVPYPRVRFSIHLRRKPMFYLINIIAPCVTMSLLALLVFYLPPDSGEKVSLGITVLLSFSVFLLLVAENVPKTSEHVPILGIYLTLIMGMTAMSIFISVVMLNVHHHHPGTPVPKWLRKFVFDCIARVLCMRKLVIRYDKQKRQHANGSIRSYTQVPDNMYFMDYIHNEHADPTETSNSSPNTVRPINRGSRKPIHEEIVFHLRTITDKLKQRDSEDHLREEWRTMAKILDRCFLVVFLCLIIVFSLILLFIYPFVARLNRFND